MRKQINPGVVCAPTSITSTSMTTFFFSKFLASYLPQCLKPIHRDFPGGPVVKNPLSNVGDRGSIPSRGAKIPHAAGQLSPHAVTTELARLNESQRAANYRAHTPQLEKRNSAHHNYRSPRIATKDPAHGN